MQHQLVAGIAEVARERAEVARDQARKVAAGLGRERVLEGAAVLARQDPGLERRARGVRHERGEGRRQLRHALLGGDLLTDHVAVETAALVLVVLARLVQLAPGLVEHDRDGGHPRVRVVRQHAGLLVVPVDEDVADLAVPLEVEEAVAVHPQHALDLLGVHGGQRGVVVRRLDDELAGTARRDHVEHPDALAHQLPLDPKVGVGLGNHAHRPAGAVGERAILAVGGDLAPGQVLGAGTVTARRVGYPRAFWSHKHPLPTCRIFPQLVHRLAVTP